MSPSQYGKVTQFVYQFESCWYSGSLRYIRSCFSSEKVGRFVCLDIQFNPFVQSLELTSCSSAHARVCRLTPGLLTTQLLRQILTQFSLSRKSGTLLDLVAAVSSRPTQQRGTYFPQVRCGEGRITNKQLQITWIHWWSPRTIVRMPTDRVRNHLVSTNMTHFLELVQVGSMSTLAILGLLKPL